MGKHVGRFNNTLWIVSICSVLLLVGCVSNATAIKHNNSAPSGKNCTLNIARTLIVKEFDGQKVEWPVNFGDSWATVQIPEGSHTLIMNYDRGVGMGESHYQNNITVTYDRFVAGHTYLLVAAEGAESRGFSGMFQDILGTMLDTVNQALRIGIKDVTKDPNWHSASNLFTWQDEFEWLPLK